MDNKGSVGNAPTEKERTPARASRGARIAQWVTLAFGLFVVIYALSDHPLYGGEPGFGKVQLVILVIGLLLAGAAFLRAEWNQRVLTLGVSSLFMLLVMEVGLEVALGHRYRPAVIVDERLLFKLRPDRHSEFTRMPVNGGQRILTRINRDGFVGDELLPAGAALRVFVYGDSFIHAFYVAKADRFTEVLERRLGEKLGSKVEVVNAGVASYGPDQVSVRLPDDLKRFRPDLVVVGVFAGNDFGDLVRNKFFKLDPSGALRENPHEMAADVRARFDASQRESVLVRALRGARDAFAERSPYAELPAGKDRDVALMDFWVARGNEEYKSFVVEKNNVVSNTHQDFYNADVSLLPSSHSARYKLRLMEAVLGRIQRTAADASTPLMYLFIPHPVDVVDRYDTGRIEVARFPEYRRTNLTGALATMATGAGAKFVDLFETFRSHDPARLYFRGGDDHWNETGQRLAAETVADFIVKETLLARAKR